MAMIDLYACGSPNVSKVVFMLGETELEFSVKHVCVMLGENYSPEFLSVNPNAKVPVLVDYEGPNGETQTIIESGAILLYLAEKTGLLIPEDPMQRNEVLQWLFLQMSTFGPGFGQARHFLFYAPDQIDDYSKNRFTTEACRLLDLLENRLQENEFVAGSSFSIADIAMFPGIDFHSRKTLEIGDRPAIDRWLQETRDRPGYQRITGRLDSIFKTDMELGKNMTDEDRDRLFGRGDFSRAL